MQKLSITPQAMSVGQAVCLFESLDYTGRQEFYKSLSDDEKDALYEQATDNLIARVHLTTKNRIDAKVNRDRNKRCGYILPDECHTAENDCLWRSAAWYCILGHVSKSLLHNLSHMRDHFDALQATQDKRKDLHSRMSRLSEMSAELERHIEKLTDNPEEAERLEEAYQTLFSETLRIYGK